MAFLYESPQETFFSRFREFDGFFNLMSGYRLDADAPAPYAKIVRRHRSPGTDLL